MASEPEGGEFGAVLTAVRDATEAMVACRAEADLMAIAAIELVEKRLVEVLAGESLGGLPELGAKVFGLRIGVEGSAYAKLPPRRACLVLEAKGLLVAATSFGPATAFVQRAPRGLLRASTLVPYMRAVLEALRLHRGHAERRGQDFRKVSDLSGRIAAAMAEPVS